MATSPLVYDLAIDAIGDDDPARALGRLASRAGLRCWGAAWSAIPEAPLADELSFAASAAHLTVRVIGRGSEHDLESELAVHHAVIRQPSIVVLAPGCALGPGDIASIDGAVVDWRSGRISTQDDDLPDRTLMTQLREVADGTGLAPSHIHARHVTSYDLIAEKFAAQWAHHPPLQPLEKFLERLPRHATVLDAGCGPGHHAAVLARGGHHVIGIDLSEGMLRIARRSTIGPEFRRMDMERLRFPRGSVDGVWCAAAALHVPREALVRLLRGFARVLRPSGVIGLNMQVGRASEVVNYGGDIRFFEYYRDGEQIARLAARAGLAVIATDYGETGRNTHELDLTLRWVTLYLQPH